MSDMHMERIVRTDIIATAFNRNRLKGMARIVDLACSHKAVTSAFNRCICLRCKEMFRRSIADGSEDWDSFRHAGKPDQMAWKDDPVRGLNERTDLSGNTLCEDTWVEPTGAAP